MSKLKQLLGGDLDKYMLAARQAQDAQDMLAQQNIAMMQAAQAQQHNYMLAQAQNWPSPPPNPPLSPSEIRDAMQTRAKELFLNRLKGVRGTGFRREERDFIETHIIDDKVFLFYMLRGKEGVVSEGVDIFPSDTLIAQFRLILA